MRKLLSLFVLAAVLAAGTLMSVLKAQDAGDPTEIPKAVENEPEIVRGALEKKADAPPPAAHKGELGAPTLGPKDAERSLPPNFGKRQSGGAIIQDAPLWNPGSAKSPMMRRRSQTQTVVREVMEVVSDEERAEIEAFQKQVAALKEAKADKEKLNAQMALQTSLEKFFTRDLARREKEVAEAEGRVKKLREQLDKRKTARQDIINLRLQIIEHEVDGLGFSLPFDASTEAPTLNPLYYDNSSGAGDSNRRKSWYYDYYGKGAGAGPKQPETAPSPFPADNNTFQRQQQPQKMSLPRLPARSGSDAPRVKDPQPEGVPSGSVDGPSARPAAGLDGSIFFDKEPATADELFRVLINNLTSEKEAQSIFAAKLLEGYGAEAASAIPALEEYVKMERDMNGFPSDAQREAFQKVLTRIKALGGGKPVPDSSAIEKDPLLTDERLRVIVNNLTFDKEGRTLAAAKQLEILGADAAGAIPALEKYVNMKKDPTGFPSEAQRAAFQKALAKIKAAVEANRKKEDKKDEPK